MIATKNRAHLLPRSTPSLPEGHARVRRTFPASRPSAPSSAENEKPGFFRYARRRRPFRPLRPQDQPRRARPIRSQQRCTSMFFDAVGEPRRGSPPARRAERAKSRRVIALSRISRRGVSHKPRPRQPGTPRRALARRSDARRTAAASTDRRSCPVAIAATQWSGRHPFRAVPDPIASTRDVYSRWVIVDFFDFIVRHTSALAPA